MRVKILSNDKTRFDAILQATVVADRGAEVSGSVGDITELPKVINGHAPDVLILDASQGWTLDLLDQMTARAPSMEAIVITNDQSPQFLLQAMRAGVREVLPNPVTSDALQSALNRIRGKRGHSQAQEGKILAFLSCKGGSGATFLAANLGHVLASLNDKKVAVIDLNLQFGDAALFVSENKPASNVADVAQQIHRLDASLLSAAMLQILPNFSVLAAPEDPAHGVDVKPQHVQTILTLARKHYDYVIVDLGRTLDAVTLQALDMADTIFPVLQLTLPFIRDGKRLISVMRSLDYPKSKIKLIVNRFEKSSEITINDLENALGAEVFKTIPNSYQAVATSVNQGVPITQLSRNNPVSKALSDFASAIAPEVSQQENGWFAKILGRP
ncbi:MAG TPA: AAA family ATPase [Burkholderiales bacterium]|nr:AAA family ATPase [Burkholderiales bacterium]